MTVALPPDLAGVPLGALLREDPHQALINGDYRNVKWMIRDVSFSVVISARQFLAAAKRTPTVNSQRYLGVGDPKLNRPGLVDSAAFGSSAPTRNGVSDFEELPETAQEIKDAAALFPTSITDVLTGRAGTEEAFRSKPLAQYDVIHFATHGLFVKGDRGATDAALLLTPGDAADPFNDGFLTALEISRLSLNARLVVLSACNTAKYDVAQANRSVQDLHAAFNAAGAATVLGSLWPVNSFAAQRLVTDFFRQWQVHQGRGPAHALANAVRQYLDDASAAEQHPWYWASFIVTGYGGAKQVAKPQRPSHLALVALKGFSTEGEIMRAAPTGSDVMFSVMGEQVEHRMQGIVTRRTADGTEVWRSSSREIAAGPLAHHKGITFSAGDKYQDGTIPVLRAFDQVGRTVWVREFPDLKNFLFNDLVSTNAELFVVAFPRLLPSEEARHAVVLAFDHQGRQRLSAKIPIEQPRINIGLDTLTSTWRGNLVVVLNHGLSLVGMKDDPAGVFGMPYPCNEGASARVLELDPRTLRIMTERSIPAFRAVSLVAGKDALFVGGETLNKCSLKGVASIWRFGPREEPKALWSDDEVFYSAVRGLDVEGSTLVAAIAHERTLGIKTLGPGRPERGGKRWAEGATLREGSLIRLSFDGSELERQYMSAGVGMYLQGLKIVRGRPVLYGSLGGLPALTHWVPEQPRQMKPKPTVQRAPAPEDWRITVHKGQ